jgi:N-acetylglucosamine-6-phosphate deacetylase
LNPASVVGISGRHGVLASGAEADFVVLNPQHEVIQTIVRGVGTYIENRENQNEW